MRLIEAQEVERSRIARQLHDDLSQRLVVLSLGLNSLRHHVPAGQHETINLLQQQAIELSNEIRHLSHELHPGILRHAGLVSALRQHCRELSDARQLHVIFEVPAELPEPAAALSFCLYRVAQEALRNTIRHAGPCQARVVLQLKRNRLKMTISDNGKGFDVAGSQTAVGVGLASMEERVHAVGGKLLFTSKANFGVEVAVDLPMKGLAHAPSTHHSSG